MHDKALARSVLAPGGMRGGELGWLPTCLSIWFGRVCRGEDGIQGFSLLLGRYVVI